MVRDLIAPRLIAPVRARPFRLPQKRGHTVLLADNFEKPNFTPRALPGPGRGAMRQQNMY